ncbi:MAG TPA: chemotaxis protein CheW [Fimbriimonadaceae bacterium]|nr:chemotaxis protein CheW [Fimbriimonadaceae bacterium]HRJ31962.1 chemotaxis protein CheW [Fimbriimonadaceae bacterium]
MHESTSPSSSVPGTETQTVVFQLGSECYGVDIFRVSEIIQLRDITPVPRTQPYIRGLVNLRGKTIPVVDLRARFGLSSQDSEDTRIIVVDSEQGQVGMIVDAVREVITLSSQQIEDAPPLVTDMSTDFVRGVAKLDESLVTMLNLDRALAA